MTKFEVGQPLPLPLLKPPGHEECRVSFNEAFIDIVYWIPESEQNLVPVFTKSKLEYGLFVANDIPFFIISFPNQDWSFDVSLNIKKVQEDNVEGWLNTEANAVNMYLCDCNNNNLLGMRLIGIEHSTVEKIRDVLEKQDSRYPDAASIDKVISNIMQSYTTPDMIEKVKMIRL